MTWRGLVGSYVLQLDNQRSWYAQSGTPSPVPDWLQVLVPIIQVTFFLATATVAIVTYLQARKSLLQPLRTEVFKEQLAALRELIEFFLGPKGSNLREYFGFDEVYLANVKYLFLAYRTNLTGEEISAAELKTFPRRAMFRMPADELVEIVAGHFKLDPANDRELDLPRRPWQDYKHQPVYIPESLHEAKLEIGRFLANPLLPSRCTELLQQLLNSADENLAKTADLLTEVAQEMPDHYPDLPTFEKGADYWIRFRWNREIVDLDPIGEEIVRFARTYFNPDTLYLSDRKRSRWARK